MYYYYLLLATIIMYFRWFIYCKLLILMAEQFSQINLPTTINSYFHPHYLIIEFVLGYVKSLYYFY